MVQSIVRALVSLRQFRVLALAKQRWVMMSAMGLKPISPSSAHLVAAAAIIALVRQKCRAMPYVGFNPFLSYLTRTAAVIVISLAMPTRMNATEDTALDKLIYNNEITNARVSYTDREIDEFRMIASAIQEELPETDQTFQERIIETEREIFKLKAEIRAISAKVHHYLSKSEGSFNKLNTIINEFESMFNKVDGGLNRLEDDWTSMDPRFFTAAKTPLVVLSRHMR